MSTEIATRNTAALAEQVAIAGDLSKLSPEQRMAYYGEVCRSLGLNPLTRPFQYITLNNKLTLYATRDATDQLRRQHKVSIVIVGRERIEDVYVVTARATAAGRSDESTGVVSIGNLKGDNLANALMKAETKAKRRVTLSICGLGWLDESEIETVRGARRPAINHETGEILDDASNDASREQLVSELRGAYVEAKRAGADVAPPGRDEVAGWTEETIRNAMAVFRAAAQEAQQARENELDAIAEATK